MHSSRRLLRCRRFRWAREVSIPCKCISRIFSPSRRTSPAFAGSVCRAASRKRKAERNCRSDCNCSAPRWMKRAFCRLRTPTRRAPTGIREGRRWRQLGKNELDRVFRPDEPGSGFPNSAMGFRNRLARVHARAGSPLPAGTQHQGLRGLVRRGPAGLAGHGGLPKSVAQISVHVSAALRAFSCSRRGARKNGPGGVSRAAQRSGVDLQHPFFHLPGDGETRPRARSSLRGPHPDRARLRVGKLFSGPTEPASARASPRRLRFASATIPRARGCFDCNRRGHQSLSGSGDRLPGLPPLLDRGGCAYSHSGIFAFPCAHSVSRIRGREGGSAKMVERDVAQIRRKRGWTAPGAEQLVEKSIDLGRVEPVAAPRGIRPQLQTTHSRPCELRRPEILDGERNHSRRRSAPRSCLHRGHARDAATHAGDGRDRVRAPSSLDADLHAAFLRLPFCVAALSVHGGGATVSGRSCFSRSARFRKHRRRAARALNSVPGPGADLRQHLPGDPAPFHWTRAGTLAVETRGRPRRGARYLITTSAAAGSLGSWRITEPRRKRRRDTAVSQRKPKRSATPKLILEVPRARSRKTMGISRTRRFLPPPTIASNAILKPAASGANSRRSVLRMAKKPHIELCTPVSG